MGISHSFDIDIAKIYGVNAAILLKHIGHWIDKNKANGKHFYDGNYWTYNSVKAFKELFPYMSEKVIRNTLKKLEDDGIIITGNYNKVAYDRTTWYALTEKGKSIFLLGKMEIDERENGNIQKGEPIPYINTDNNTNITSDKSEAPEKKSKKKPIYDHTSIPYRAAKWLSEQIMERLPEQKAYSESDLQRWADDFRLMNTSDGYEWELIEKVLQYSQEDYFWSQNILSASKFRKQFSTLLAKAKASGYV